eukprot:g25695.t1
MTNRIHILAQAPDCELIMGYQFPGAELNPITLASLPRSVWRRMPAITGLPTNGAVLSIYDLRGNVPTPGIPFHRDDERFMKHDDIVNLTLGASTATITLIPYGDQFDKLAPQSRYRSINLDHGTLHTFNRFQLHRVDFAPITPNSREESSHRISLSFREFVTWADVAAPSRDPLARDTNEELPDRILAFLRTGTHEDTKILPVAQTSNVAPIPDTGPTHPRTIALLKGDPDVSTHLRASPEGISIDALLQTRGRLNLRRPEHQRHYSTITTIRPPPPTVLILNQTAIKDRFFRGGRTVGSWGPNSRTPDEKNSNLRLFFRDYLQNPGPGFYGHYHTRKFSSSNVISILVLDPQDIYGATNIIHLAEHKLTGAMLFPSPYEYRCVPAEASYDPSLQSGLRGSLPSRPPGANRSPDHQVLHSITRKYGVVTRISTGAPVTADATPPSTHTVRRTLNYSTVSPNESQAPIRCAITFMTRLAADNYAISPPPPPRMQRYLRTRTGVKTRQTPHRYDQGRPPQGEEPSSGTPRTQATPSVTQGDPDDAIPSQTNPSSISPTDSEPLFSDTSRARPSSGMSGCGYSGEGGNGPVREPRVAGVAAITTPSTLPTPPAPASNQSGLARPTAQRHELLPTKLQSIHRPGEPKGPRIHMMMAQLPPSSPKPAYPRSPLLVAARSEDVRCHAERGHCGALVMAFGAPSLSADLVLSSPL